MRGAGRGCPARAGSGPFRLLWAFGAGGRGEHGVDEEVELPDQQAPGRSAKEPGHDLDVDVGDRPTPGVGEHQAVEGVRALSERGEADRATPVVRDEGDAAELEGVDERGEDLGVLLGQALVARSAWRKPEAREVDSDAAKLAAQGADNVTVDEGPGGVAVHQQQQGSRSFVDVMHRLPIDGEEAALEREEVVVDPARSGGVVRHGERNVGAMRSAVCGTKASGRVSSGIAIIMGWAGVLRRPSLRVPPSPCR